MTKELTNREMFPLLEKKKSELAKIVKSNMAGQQVDAFTFERCTVPSGGSTKWTVQTEDGEQLRESIEGVIICAYDTRAYWVGSEDTNELSSSPPDCSSLDCDTGSGRRFSDEEIGRRDCSTCAKGQWESGKDGRGQACKVKKRVFIITPDSLMPVPIAVFLPPTSLRAFVNYIMGLLRFGLQPHDVVTELRLVPDKGAGGEPFARVVPKNLGRIETLVGEDAPGKFATIAAELTPILKSAKIDDWNEGESS